MLQCSVGAVENGENKESWKKNIIFPFTSLTKLADVQSRHQI